MNRFTGSILAAILLAAAGALAVQAPAHAIDLGVICTTPSNRNISYDPPLSSTPQTTHIVSMTTLSPCVAPTVPALNSGVSIAEVTVISSCASLLNTSTVSSTITWNTGHASSYTATTTATFVGAALVTTRTGTITNGLFTGAAIEQVSAAPATSVLTCLLGLGTISDLASTVELLITPA